VKISIPLDIFSSAPSKDKLVLNIYSEDRMKHANNKTALHQEKSSICGHLKFQKWYWRFTSDG
jgi:hypothetical protein